MAATSHAMFMQCFTAHKATSLSPNEKHALGDRCDWLMGLAQFEKIDSTHCFSWEQTTCFWSNDSSATH